MMDWSYEFSPLKNISLHLLNLGAPPVSQEGEKRKIYWIIQSITACQNCSWLAEFKLREFYLKKILFHLLNLLGGSPVRQEGEKRETYWSKKYPNLHNVGKLQLASFFLLQKSLSSQNAFLKNALPALGRRGLKITAHSVIGCVL